MLSKYGNNIPWSFSIIISLIRTVMAGHLSYELYTHIDLNFLNLNKQLNN